MAESKVLTLGPPRTSVVVADSGESVRDVLLDLAREHGIRAASLTAIGGLRSAMLAYFDVDTKQYLDIPVDEQAEVLSLSGDIVTDENGEPTLHAHAVLGLRDGSTKGGHLKDGTVRPTLEVTVTDSPNELTRRYDENVGLALIDLAADRPAGQGGRREDVPRGVVGDLRGAM